MQKVYRETMQGCLETTMKELPSRCTECANCFCLLPFMDVTGRVMRKMKNAYYEQRHKNCPLFLMEVPE